MGKGYKRVAILLGVASIALIGVWSAAAAPDTDEPLARWVARAAGRGGAYVSQDAPAAARAILAQAPPQEDRRRWAQAAVRLAPDLPLAHMEVADADWRIEGDYPRAIRSWFSALLAIERHVAASLWLRTTLWLALAAIAIGAGLFFIGGAALASLSSAAHDLGDSISRELSTHARWALLGSLLLVPFVLGEGWVGFGLLMFALAYAYGTWRMRAAVMLAAAAVWAGLYPVGERVGATLAALQTDSVARSVHAASDGVLLPVERARLEAAPPGDWLAATALAMAARRSGDLREANTRFAALLEVADVDPSVENNAANVRFQLGDIDGAIELYEQASANRASVDTLFNLAQAYGEGIRLDEQDRVLGLAQTIDAERVRELTRRLDTEEGRVLVDIPLPAEHLRSRLLASDRGPEVAAVLRQRIAPGWLGGDAEVAGGALLAFAVGGLFFAQRFRLTRRCARCTVRMCPRCHPRLRASRLCEVCAPRVQRGGATRGVAGVRQLQRLRWTARVRTFVAVFVPGAGAILGGRPLEALIATFAFAIALASLLSMPGIVPDPLAVGASAPLAFLAIGLLAAFLYAILALRSVVHLRRGSR